MNHRQPRANRLPAGITKVVACPDCDSDVTLGECGHIEIHHAETCPWYIALQAAGGLGIRFGHWDTP